MVGWGLSGIPGKAGGRWQGVKESYCVWQLIRRAAVKLVSVCLVDIAKIISGRLVQPN